MLPWEPLESPSSTFLKLGELYPLGLFTLTLGVLVNRWLKVRFCYTPCPKSCGIEPQAFSVSGVWMVGDVDPRACSEQPCLPGSCCRPLVQRLWADTSRLDSL